MSALGNDDSYSAFTWRTCTLNQGEGVLKIGTDAILLGTWIGKLDLQANHIIDAGCGTGILSIMAAVHFPHARITAIDSNATAVALTYENARCNGLHPQIHPVKADLFHDVLVAEEVDLILSNPPYFLHQLPSPERARNEARHAVHSPAAWMMQLSSMAKPEGCMAFIVPSAGASTWIAGANEAGWYCQRRLNVYAFSTTQQPVRSLLLFTTQLQRSMTESLIMYDRLNCLSDNYKAWLK
jgi:tRNA1Val (adenine37-N6)-methyltransferase